MKTHDTKARQRAAELVSRMSVEEKAAFCSGRDNWNTKSLDRLGIPSIMMTDGPHGLRKVAAEEGVSASEPATCFPTAAALASTWNSALLKRVGMLLAEEAKAQGVSIVLGPGANIKRGPLGGRNFEYFSEDPVLAGDLAAAFISGVQSQGVGTSLKHFVANNQETGRMSWDARVPMRALREIYLRGFERAIRKARPTTVMCAYNKVNGEFCSQNPFLLHTVLKKEWGYEGIVVSDWGAVEDRAAGVAAGLHLQMPFDGGGGDAAVVAAVRSGELAESRLDEIVTETLATVLALAPKEASAQPEDEGKESASGFDHDAHHRMAREAASDAIILLKNERKVLPLQKESLSRLAVIGRFAKEPRIQGHGSSRVNETRIDIPLDEISHAFSSNRGSEAKVAYADGYAAEGATDEKRIQAAVEAAESAESAVIFAGLPSSYESEGYDRKHMDIPEGHIRLIRAVVAVQPRTIVVLQNGSPVDMEWDVSVPAVLETWMSGQGGGKALADILFGEADPGGRLPETIPQSLEDNPTYLSWPGENRTAIYAEGIFVGYRYYDVKGIEPRYPFGHGLSYTTFEYGDFTVEQPNVYEDETVECRFTIRNTGSRRGKDVAQLYVSAPNDGPVSRARKELQDFTKVELEAGEEREITMRCNVADLAYYDVSEERWTVQPGVYVVSVGSSSRDINLRGSIEIQLRQEPVMTLDRYSSFKEWRQHPVGGPLVADLFQQMLSAFGLEIDESEGADSADARALTEMFAAMPIGKLIGFSRGRFSEEMLTELIEKVNAASKQAE